MTAREDVVAPRPLDQSPAGLAARLESAGVGDRIYRTIITAFAACVPLLLVVIAIEIGVAAWPALHTFGFSFLVSSDWDPVNGSFGAAPALYGTIVSALLALLIATPLAIGVAIYLSEFAPSWLRQPVSFLVDLLAAVPSVVYGLWGIFVLIPLLRTHVVPFLTGTLHLGATPLFSGPNYGPSMIARITAAIRPRRT